MLLVCLFILGVARHYRPGLGFTEMLVLPEANHATELPAFQAVPHFHHPSAVAYDGQFYAQIALDPLLRDPRLEGALDSPIYRERRILFSWTAWLLGLGRPAWVVLAYTLQNVVAWLVLAWWLARRFPADDWRGMAIWAAVLSTHGLLASVRLAVLDGPSLLVVAFAVAASESGHPVRAALLTGLAGLGRETNLLASASLGGDLRDSGRRRWLVIAVSALLVVLPLLLWIDYLRSVYLESPLQNANSVTVPFTVFLEQWRDVLRSLSVGVVREPAGLLALVSLTAQAAFLLVRARASFRNPWWRLGIVYAVLLVSVNVDVWEGNPGSATRVLLPLTLAFNLLLPASASPGFWPWLVVGNLPSLLAWRTL